MSWFVMLSDLSKNDIKMLEQRYDCSGIDSDEDCFGIGPSGEFLDFYWSKELIEVGHVKIEKSDLYLKLSYHEFN